MSNTNKSTNEVLIQAIHEFLLKWGYFQTLDILSKEGSAKPKGKTNDQNLATILSTLEKGDQENFFKLWTRIIPKGSQRSIESQKVEFYIRVFFTIYPLHPLKRKNNTKPTQQDQRDFKTKIESLKQFLETRGESLSKAEEFLHFYALPYIPSPNEHPTFKHFFTKTWYQELVNRVTTYLRTHLTPAAQPFLIQMYNSYQTRGSPAKRSPPKQRSPQRSPPPNQRSPAPSKSPPPPVMQPSFDDVTIQLQAEVANLRKKEENARKTLLESQGKWTDFSRELLAITKELYNRLNNSENPDDLGPVYEKIVKYDNFLNQGTGAEDTSQNISFSRDESRALTDYSLSPIPHRQYDISSAKTDNKNMMKGHGPYATPNYALIVRDLDELQDEYKLSSLLQALRWRLTRSQNYVRKEVMNQYIRYNILQTTKPHDQQLERLLTASQRIKEYTVRFLNVISSECAGRGYLLDKEGIVNHLVRIFFDENEDTLLRQNSLGCLQKLSLRRDPQSLMIELGMIDHLGRLLQSEEENISFYTLEYATALLMNLSLRTAGKDCIEETQVDMLMILNNLLEHENLQVRTYVNGTLYSILTRSKLKERALRLGMDEALRYLMAESDEHFKRQIQYILEQLQSEQEDDAQSEENEDDMDNAEDEGEAYEYIAEDEDMDDILDVEGLISGEELMENYKLDNVGAPQINNDEIDQAEVPPAPVENPAGKTEPELRKLPSEMKSRPKIPRTPLDASRPKPILAKGAKGGKNLPQINTTGSKDSLVIEPRSPTPQGTMEFDHAFRSRNRIRRSPK